MTRKGAFSISCSLFLPCWTKGPRISSIFLAGQAENAAWDLSRQLDTTQIGGVKLFCIRLIAIACSLTASREPTGPCSTETAIQSQLAPSELQALPKR